MKRRHIALVTGIAVAMSFAVAHSQSASPHQKSAQSTTASSQDADPYAEFNQCITDANTAMNQCVDAGKNTLLVCQPAETKAVKVCNDKFDHPKDDGSGKQ